MDIEDDGVPESVIEKPELRNSGILWILVWWWIISILSVVAARAGQSRSRLGLRCSNWVLEADSGIWRDFSETVENL